MGGEGGDAAASSTLKHVGPCGLVRGLKFRLSLMLQLYVLNWRLSHQGLGLVFGLRFLLYPRQPRQTQHLQMIYEGGFTIKLGGLGAISTPECAQTPYVTDS